MYRFPAQEHIGGDAKIPSILFYDQTGMVRAVGAEALQESVIVQAEEEEWVKSEWYEYNLQYRALSLDFTDNIIAGSSYTFVRDLRRTPISPTLCALCH